MALSVVWVSVVKQSDGSHHVKGCASPAKFGNCIVSHLQAGDQGANGDFIPRAVGENARLRQAPDRRRLPIQPVAAPQGRLRRRPMHRLAVTRPYVVDRPKWTSDARSQVSC